MLADLCLLTLAAHQELMTRYLRLSETLLHALLSS